MRLLGEGPLPVIETFAFMIGMHALPRKIENEANESDDGQKSWATILMSFVMFHLMVRITLVWELQLRRFRS